MKKPYLLIVSSFLALGLTACGGSIDNPGHSEGVSSSSAPLVSSDESTDSEGSSLEPMEGQFTGILRIYFHNDTGTENSFAIYAWTTLVDGMEFEWDGVEAGYGVYKDFDLSADPWQGKVEETFFFIIKKPATWAGQSSDTPVVLDDFASTETMDASGKRMRHVYAAQGEGNAIDVYDNKSDANGDHFLSFYLDEKWDRFQVTSIGECSAYILFAFDNSYYSHNQTWQALHKEDFQIGAGNPNLENFEILGSSLKFPDGKAVQLSPSVTYQLEGVFASAPNKTKKKIATFEHVFDTQKFISEYTYSGNDLGVTYKGTTSEFRVWSPISSRVNLVIYPDKDQKVAKDPMLRFALVQQAGGVWSGSVEMDLKNYGYAFEYYYGNAIHVGADPYATSCGVNGTHSGIVDFASTNPAGWDDLHVDTLAPNQLTAYEVHVRDFTASSTWVSNEGNENGTYNAFHEKGTTYNGVTTGYDHLKEMGVNAVQFLPVFDQDNDERTLEIEDERGNTQIVKPAYNWGYNPQNYNCVEGSYSSDPYSFTKRIEEYKALISDLASDGMRTIMDVVYNHVSSVSTHPFSIAVPRYYFRYDENAYLIDDTGVGNTVNSDRIMVHRYIVDSVKFWASEYKIKGFRFDLMGALNVDVMRDVKDALYDIDPNIVVYGEGWIGGVSGYHGEKKSANTDNVYLELGDNGKGAVGCFNDAYRDGSKGNTTWADVTPSGGFFSGDYSDNHLWKTSVGALGQNHNLSSRGVFTPANQTVDYITCHDNYTLFDQFNFLLHGQSESGVDHEDAKQAAIAATAHSMFGNGIGFLHGGDEFFRTKLMKRGDPMFDKLVESYKHMGDGKSQWIEGDGCKIDEDTWLVRNSYKYGDAVNAFDWARKAENIDGVNKIKDAIALRSSLMNNIFGLEQSKLEPQITCLGGAIIGAGFSGTDGMYMVLSAGQQKGNVESCPDFRQGEYEVIYCSSSRLPVGNQYYVGYNVGMDAKGETLLLKRK